MKKLYLVDVSSMYFRAFYAIRPLSNAAGMPTNALYGFLSMTTKLLKQLKPDYVAFCFDLKEPSFRLGLYSEYKANRSAMPEELVPQVPYVRKLTDALGVPAFSRSGYEADDLIGALAVFGRKHDLEVVIVSGDKDFGQLVQPYVSIYDTMKDVKYDAKGVEEKIGVPPAQVIDYMALVGDSSDNVPGVAGIGPKGAQKLLAQFKTLDEIYSSLDLIANKNLVKKLEQSKEMAFLSRKLVTIETDIKLIDSIEELRMREVDREGLMQLLTELDFKSFAKNLLNTTAAPAEVAEAPVANIVSVEQAPAPSRFIETELSEQNVDAEQLAQMVKPGEEIWGLWGERGLYFGVGKKVLRFQGEAHRAGEILTEKAVSWSGFDLKALWKNLKVANPRPDWDQALAAYVISPGAAESFEDLYAKYVGGRVPELPTAAQYVHCQYQLKESLQKKLIECNGVQVLKELELPLIPVLYAMEERGIRLDVEELNRQNMELTSELKDLEKSIHEEAGGPFNIASSKQLAQILFVKMGIAPIKKIKTGFSTDSDVLEKLSAEHKIARLVTEFREVAKLKSTYVEALPLLVNKYTGRIHTHFNQVLTATGRLSSHDPNLQNIPIRTVRGSRVRRAFVADAGNVLLSIDYSQIELRVLAHITADPGLCQAFAQNQDVHAATASQIYGVELSQVTEAQRRNAKAVNFGIAYGQGPFGLAENLGISRREATDIIGRYFSRFAKVRDYMVDVVEEGKKRGYVETLFGRRRYLQDLSAKNQAMRKVAERAAINAPVQGAASDIVKKAMISIDQQNIPGLLLQVHDELLFEVREESVVEMEQKIAGIMENIVKLNVPLKVNVAHGINWELAHA